MNFRVLLPSFILFAGNVFDVRELVLSDVVNRAGIVAALAGRQRAQPRRTPPTGAVYSESMENYPDHAIQSVEFTRFVTAYGTGLEAIVDVTPYSPLLRSAATANSNLTLYSFIDTWVGNDTGTTMLYMDNVSGVCSATTHSDGNGWSVSANLLFWGEPESTAVDTTPYASVTIAAGAFGSEYRIGAITVHEAEIHEGSTVILSEATDFRNVVDASVYPCSGKDSLSSEAFLGYIAVRAGQLGNMKDTKPVDSFTKDMVEYISYGGLSLLTVKQVFANNNIVRVEFKANETDLQPGMPVFYNPSDIFTDTQIDAGVWWNSSLAFVPVGEVTKVSNGTAELKMNITCLPNLTSGLPSLIAPSSPSVLPHAKELVANAVLAGEKAATVLAMRQGEIDDSSSPAMTGTTKLGSLGDFGSAAAGLDAFVAASKPGGPPLLMKPLASRTNETEAGGPHGIFDSGFQPTLPIGRLDLSSLPAAHQAVQRASFIGLASKSDVVSGPGGTADAWNPKSVCVVSTRRNGHVFERDFTVPELKSGDRVVAQLAVTGHGWAQTTEQCGEYCHAVYGIHMNGADAGKVTQFRDDCKDNPIGEGLQKGTWWEPRNGWCPGSVEPGLFFDVTEKVQSGENHASFDVTVWSNATGSYEEFTDYAGFAFGDKASLIVGLSLFVYDAAAVAAIRAQPKAFTAAERAVREGSSNPEQLHIPQHVEQPLSIVLMQAAASRPGLNLEQTEDVLQRGHRSLRGPWTNSTTPKQLVAGGEFGVEDLKPWYFWNSSQRGSPEQLTGAHSNIEVFKNKLVQSNTRVITSTIQQASLPKKWDRVALHLRLAQPPNGLEIDHWDRKASFGLLLPKGNADSLTLSPVEEAPTRQSWKLTATP